MLTFFYPYLQLLDGAVWTLEQCLAGLGIHPASLVQRIEPGRTMSFFSAPIDGAAVFLCAAMIAAAVVLWVMFLVVGYLLSKKVGLLVTFTLTLVPGLLSILSAWPAVALRPDTYVIGGGGMLGSGSGMSVLVEFGMLFGWCFSLIVVAPFGLRDSFLRPRLDHRRTLGGGLVRGRRTQVNYHAKALRV